MDVVKHCKAAVYVDGCNLFHGMRSSRLRSMYWLDLAALAQSFLKPDQHLVRLVYFTARVTGNPDKSKRHTTYIDALTMTRDVELIEGNYQLEPFHCRNCHNRRSVPKEKQTDTNIATEIVADAFQDVWDTAFIISGDSDLVPPIKRVRAVFPEKRMIVVFPPSRVSRELEQAAHGKFYLNHTMLGRNQLPDEIKLESVTLRRPAYWM